jgi:pimeloyl-ACP methyl ester carboxylesterase
MRSGTRKIAWATAVALAVCIVGAATAIGSSNAVAHPGSSGTTATTTAPAQDAPATTTIPSASSEVAAGAAAAASAVDGPYQVAVTQATYVDTGRGRTIAVTVSYPVAAAGTTFPLVVFAHGFDTSAATYSTIEQQLAADGFVVAAPDFPYTSSASGNALDESDVVNQAGDVSFVITELFDASTRPAALQGLIDTSAKVGVVGHSDGGVTAAGVAYNSSVADPRIGAAAVLSGAEITYPGPWFTTQSPPLLAVHGDADEVNPYAASQQLFDDATGPKYLVTVLGGSHLGPFTTDPVEPAVSTLVADFLHAGLQGDSAAAARIAGDADAPGLALAAQG